MRALLLPALLAAALLAPVAAAAFTLPAGRAFEDASTPGEAVTFVVPVAVERDGALYAKSLPTPGDVVTDDPRDDATGWRVTFALARAGAAPEDLGTFADDAPSRLAPVRAGERVDLRVTLHAPVDAPAGRHEAFVAVAFRAADALDGSASHGAQMDPARALALTLHLRDAGAPPPGGELPPPVAPLDFGADPAAPADAGAEASTTPAPIVLPTWFLAGVLVLLAALVAATGAVACALLGLLRARRREAPARAVEVRDGAEAPTERPRGR